MEEIKAKWSGLKSHEKKGIIFLLSLGIIGILLQIFTPDILVTPVQQRQQINITMPSEELQLLAVINKYAPGYDAAANELQKSALFNQRNNEIQNTPGYGQYKTDWYGRLESMGTNSDGNAYVVISIGKNITLSTWNNSFSDIQYKTLIPQSSPAYQAFSQMAPGNAVKFSGHMGRSILFKNLTEAGKMTSPDILFRFETAQKVGDTITW